MKRPKYFFKQLLCIIVTRNEGKAIRSSIMKFVKRRFSLLVAYKYKKIFVILILTHTICTLFPLIDMLFDLVVKSLGRGISINFWMGSFIASLQLILFPIKKIAKNWKTLSAQSERYRGRSKSFYSNFYCFLHSCSCSVVQRYHAI